jgi:hypothetical protein
MRTPAAWLRRMKRRKPGVYVYRTWRHDRPTRSEWGYAGKSRNLDTRKLCHQGICHHASCRKAGSKPWLDLEIFRWTLQLPWWLGFDFITLTLEAILIVVLRPRYNWKGNPRRDKVGPIGQKIQRAQRDARPPAVHTRIVRDRAVGLGMVLLGVAVTTAGMTGWLWTR